MKIVVLGAGGLGGYLGARLAQAGEEVHLVARGAHMTAMAERGLHVRSVLGDFALSPPDIRLANAPAAIGHADVVLFTVKSYDTEAAAGLLSPLLGPDTAVISLQNGIDNEEKIATRVGWAHVVGGAAYIFTGIAEPGVIRHNAGPTRIVVGEMDGQRTARLDAFLAACERAGFEAEVAPDIRVALWTKYAFICAQAGITAATRKSIGVVRDTPPTWALFRQVVEEVWRVGLAEGVKLPDDLVERHLAFARALDPGGFASLFDDMVAGRRMELDALLGELVRRAASAGVPVPTSSVLYAILLPWSEHTELQVGVRGSAPATPADPAVGRQGRLKRR